MTKLEQLKIEYDQAAAVYNNAKSIIRLYEAMPEFKQMQWDDDYMAGIMFRVKKYRKIKDQLQTEMFFTQYV